MPCRIVKIAQCRTSRPPAYHRAQEVRTQDRIMLQRNLLNACSPYRRILKYKYIYIPHDLYPPEKCIVRYDRKNQYRNVVVG